MANSFAMTHDETVYTDPYLFNPDRHAAKEDGSSGEPFSVGHFGFGGR